MFDLEGEKDEKYKERLLDRFSRLDTYDRAALISLCIVLVFLLALTSKFQHIPSPLYGGDYYMARGFTQAILNGQPFWEDFYFENMYNTLEPAFFMLQKDAYYSL